MTVSGTGNSISHIADGIQTVFPYDFLIADNDDMDVFLADVQQSTGFTTTGAGNELGGNVTFDVAPAVGESPVALVRNTPRTQLVDYTPFDPFPSETHEKALDKLTLIAQDEAAEAVNAIRAPASETLAKMILPAAAARANQLALFDTLGDVTTVKTDVFSLATLQAFTNYLVDTFVGNGVETQFTLQQNPIVIGNTQVYFDGVYQNKANYSLLEDTLIFTTAPPDLVVVEVMHGQASQLVDGNVDGPDASTDEAIARFDGVSGHILQNSGPVINDDGRIISGHTTSITSPGSITPQIQVHGLTGNIPSMGVFRWDDNGGAAGFTWFKSRSSVIGVNQILEDGDGICNLAFVGDGGDDQFDTFSAQFQVKVDGVPVLNGVPTSMTFATTSVGGGGAQPRMIIRQNGFVGINTIDPDDLLHVQLSGDSGLSGPLGGDQVAWFQNSGGAGESAVVSVVAGTTGLARLTLGHDGNPGIAHIARNNSTGAVEIQSSGIGPSVNIDATGAMSNVFQPCFNASQLLNALNATGNGLLHRLIFDVERFDQNNDYNGLDTFTAPKTGKYQFNINITTGGYLTGSTLLLSLQTSNRDYAQSSNDVTPFGSGEQHQTHMSVLVDMDAGDTAFCELTVSGEASDLITVFAGGAVNFSGALIA